MKVDKETVCKFLKKLNKELLSRYSEMKTEFERNPPSNNEIRKKFLVSCGLMLVMEKQI